MLELSFVELTSILFIELNKQKTKRKLLLSEIVYFNELISLTCQLDKIDYSADFSDSAFKKIRFDYNYLFDCFETEHGYEIGLKKDISILDLQYIFNNSYTLYLKKILSEIDIETLIGYTRNKTN